MSFTNSLATRSMVFRFPTVPDDVSLESCYKDLASVDRDLSQAVITLESFQALTGAYFKDNLFDAETAKLYQISVESLMLAAGLQVPAHVLVPSFESAEQYSAEAGEKKEGFLKKIWEWIKKTMAALWNAIKRLVGARHAHYQKNVYSLKAMKERLKKATDKEVKTFSGHVASHFVSGGKITLKVADVGKVNAEAMKMLTAAEKVIKDLTQIDLTTGKFEDSKSIAEAVWPSDHTYDLGATGTVYVKRGLKITREWNGNERVAVKDITPLSIAELVTLVDAQLKNEEESYSRIKGFYNAIMEAERAGDRAMRKYDEFGKKAEDALIKAMNDKGINHYHTRAWRAALNGLPGHMWRDEEIAILREYYKETYQPAVKPLRLAAGVADLINKAANLAVIGTQQVETYDYSIIRLLAQCVNCYPVYDKDTRKGHDRRTDARNNENDTIYK